METLNLVKIPGLYAAAYRAYSGTSFSPERRATDSVAGHESELNEDLAGMPEGDRIRYTENYKKYLFAWLSAKSRCLSSMITGPANFPVRRNEKANNSEHNRSVEFTEWRSKALYSIAKRIEESKPEAQKVDEQFTQFKKQVDRLFEGWGVTNFKGRLETVAKSGNAELVEKVLEYLKFMQIEKNRVLVTPRNGIWSLGMEAEKNRELAVDQSCAESTEQEVAGVRVVKNTAEDRIQLFFDGKPEPETIASLKHAAFKWSPSRGCWQRQLTSNAVHATDVLLSNLLKS